jgi:branched-chain amino acid transport system permease protein
VVGVAIAASAEDGFSGSATSGADGTWAIPLPGPGSYEVLLDEATLPEDLGLRDPDRNPLIINVLSSSKTVQFPLGEEEAASSVLLSRGTQLLIDGLVFGLILALSGVGLSLIFGTTGLTNFAHGDLMTFGALSALVLNNYVGLPFLVAAALALVLSAAFGWAQDAGLWRPLRRRGTGLIAMLVVSIGFGILLRYGYLFIFGGSTVSYAQYSGQAGLEIGPISITPKSLMASAIAIVALVTTILWLQRSRMGKASRAISDNPALASASGIDVEQVISRIWIIGTTLAALGGIIYSLSNGVTWIQGFQVLLLVFAGVVVGGLGTIWGALVGCLLVGVLIQLSTLVVPPELKNLGALVVLILVLLVRPQGILGRAERIG